jgi:hypothetical protein
VAMLFDFSTMSSDEQSRVQKTSIDFIHTQLKPADLVCIMKVVDTRRQSADH